MVKESVGTPPSNEIPPEPAVLLFGTEDGWHYVPDHPQLHYFFQGASMCKLYETKPEGSKHKNVEILHCDKCKQTLKKLLQVQKHIEGKKLNTKQVFTLLEILDKIKLNKGLTDKEHTAEHAVVVLGKPDGSKETLETGKNPNGRK
jgi:hypothetical protein